MASGGYTVKLAPGTRVPESYYCPLCKLLLRNAVQTSEGDRLCEECFKTIAKYGDNMLDTNEYCIQTASFASKLILHIVNCVLEWVWVGGWACQYGASLCGALLSGDACGVCVYVCV